MPFNVMEDYELVSLGAGEGSKFVALTQKVRAAILELVVAGSMGLIALVASVTGMAVVLFPELAAMSHDVLIRPNGKWAREPFRLILAPTLTATFGLFCTRHLNYAVWNILLIVIVSLVIIRLLRSSMTSTFARRTATPPSPMQSSFWSPTSRP